MIEQRNGLDFKWPREFDPSLEKVFDYGLFYLVAKPIRKNKPERDLSALAPRTPELQNILGPIRDVYKMCVDPGGTAGFHYHDRKIELIYPLGDLFVFFHEITTGKQIGLKIPERVGDTCFGVLVKHGVAHTLRNPSQTDYTFYIVLSNMFEEEAERFHDIKMFDYNLPPVQSLELLLTPFK